MAILDVSHPDIMRFITEKATVERMAHDLVAAGWSADWNGKVGTYLPFQNANNSVRVTDDFMRAVQNNDSWTLVWNGVEAGSLPAQDIWREIGAAAAACGCPGIQFHDACNRMHTAPSGGAQYATNPCSEYSFINDSACNLAHLRLQSFLLPDGNFDYDSYEAAVRIAIIAQDVIVDRASYPTEKIAKNSRRYRPLGLGWAGGGALLMSLGLPYDSEQGRDLLATITSCHAAAAWIASSEIAEVKGRFDTDPADAEATGAVLDTHVLASDHNRHSRDRWDRALCYYGRHGVRNAQLTLLAPTGTCGIAMDADTNGCEPFFAPVTYKTLASGGSMKLAVEAAGAGLARLGYTPNQVGAILAHVAEHERFDDVPYLDSKHAAVFDCALPGKGGTRCISPRAHVDMMAVLQPFLSGAISKTCNLPAGSTAKDVLSLYMYAWQLDLKALAVYVDGCKFNQPIKTGGEKSKKQEVNKAIRVQPVRERLPADRRAHNRHFNIGGVDGYITIGFYEDGRVGEVFTRLGKQNPTVASLFDAYMTAMSISLQYGVPLEVFLDKGEGMEFAPAGFTGDDLLSARSLVDYVCRYLRRFLPGAHELDVMLEGATTADVVAAQVPWAQLTKADLKHAQTIAGAAGGPPCAAGTGCPGTMQTRGPCQQCDTCGHRQGCGG